MAFLFLSLILLISLSSSDISEGTQFVQANRTKFTSYDMIPSSSSSSSVNARPYISKWLRSTSRYWAKKSMFESECLKWVRESCISEVWHEREHVTQAASWLMIGVPDWINPWVNGEVTNWRSERLTDKPADHQPTGRPIERWNDRPTNRTTERPTERRLQLALNNCN